MLTFIYDFSKWLYTNNDSHFIRFETISLFENHDIWIIQVSINYFSFIELIEWNV